MKEIILIKEEIKNDMSQEYQQLLKGLKKSEIVDIISFLESKQVELPEDFKSPSSSLKKETLIELCISIVKANESSEKWMDILKETPYLDALVVSESEAGEPAEEEEEQKEEEEISDASDIEGECCDEEECCNGDAVFSYEPTLKEQIQWKIYDFKWEMLLLNDSIKSFCTSVDGLFQISSVVELFTLFTFVYKFQNGLTHCPYLVEKIGNQKLLLFLKYLEIFIGYVSVFIAAPLAVSYYFNFLPEPVEEEEEDEDEDDYEDEDDLYASDSEDDEYDDLVAPEDADSEEEDAEIEEIEENDASEEGEDVNELLLKEEADDYDYEDLDSEDYDDFDFEDDYDYEDYPNLTLVDENEKDSFDPFTYSLAKVGIAYIIYRVGTGVCEFNSLAIDSKLYEVSIALGIVGTLISLYH